MKSRTFLNASGQASGIHVGWDYYLVRARGFNLRYAAGWDYKNREEDVVTYLMETDKSYHTFTNGLIGNSTDKWAGGGTNNFSLVNYNGFLKMDSLDAVKYDAVKAKSAGEFNRLKYTFVRKQYIAERLSGTFAFSGQVTDNNVESSQKFSLGGVNGVRAYPHGEVDGDEGWLIRAELTWKLPVKVKNGKSPWQLVAFYDAGKVTINKHSWDASVNERLLRGIGLGVNWIDTGNLAVKTSYAWKVGHEPIKTDPGNNNGYLWIQAITYF